MRRLIFLICIVGIFVNANAQWSDKSEINTPISDVGELGNSMTKMVKTSDGMMYVSYTTGGGAFNTKLQLVDKDGNSMWPNGGIMVSDHPSASWTTDYTLCVTPDDCAVITFSDSRHDDAGNGFWPSVYKINKNGEFLWGKDGISLPGDPTTMGGMRPRMCVTNSGNIIVGFTGMSNTSTFVVFTKLSPDGDVIWSGLEIKYAGMVNFVPSGADGFILTYYITSGSSAQFYAERYNANGEAVWGAPVAIDASGRISPQNEPYIMSDGENGVVAIYGISVSNAEFYVMMQRVSVDGDLLMSLDGVKCSDTYEIHTSGRFDVDPERGEIFIFETCYSGSDVRGLRVNKFDMYGETLWDSEGVEFVDREYWGYMTHGVSHTGDGGAILIYTKNDVGTNKILATKIEGNGTTSWKDVVLCNSNGIKGRLSCSPFYNDQVCVFWEDSRNGNKEGGDIYGQNVSIEGKLGIVYTGIEENIANDGSVSIYPNPAKDFITIKSESGSIESISIFDISGRMVINNPHFMGGNIDISQLKAGIYVFNAITTEGSLTKRFVVK